MYDGQLVRLRAFEQTDLTTEHAFVNDFDTIRGMMSGIPFPSSLQDESRFLDQQSSYSRGEYEFAVEDYNGTLVGRCGIIRVDWKNRIGELGIMIGSPYRRRGYGKEAMNLLCRFCFEEMNLHKLKVNVFGFNTAALRCYEDNGFVREGILKKELFRSGRYQDVVLLARLAN